MSTLMTSPLSPGSPARVNRRPSISSEASTGSEQNGVSGQLMQEDVDGYEFDIYHFLGNNTFFQDCPLQIPDRIKVNIALKDALYRAFYDSAHMAPSLNMTLPAKLAHLLHQPPGQKVVNRIRVIDSIVSTIRRSISFETVNKGWNRHDGEVTASTKKKANPVRKQENSHEVLNFEECAEMLQFIHLASITFRKNEELPVMSGGDPSEWQTDYAWDWSSVADIYADDAADATAICKDSSTGGIDGDNKTDKNEEDDEKDQKVNNKKRKSSSAPKGSKSRKGEVRPGSELSLSIPTTQTLQPLPKCVRHCCDLISLRRQMTTAKGISFVANGSILPRQSGDSDKPLQEDNVIRFTSPASLEHTFMLPCSQKQIKGMLIKKGITLITGGGYHGKTTMLKAIASGKHDHIQGDGREYVITTVRSDFIRSEDGRRVHTIDISPFVSNLPPSARMDPHSFSTANASGSTSQASSVIEVMAMNTELILMDEDTSAVNFMLRDSRMRALIEKETITPFIYRVNGLYSQLDISTIVVIGGSGDWLDVMNVTLRLDNYQCEDATSHARLISKAFSSGRVTYNGQGTVHQLPWGVSSNHAQDISDNSHAGNKDASTGEEKEKDDITLLPSRCFSISSLATQDDTPVNISPNGQVLYYGDHIIDLSRIDNGGIVCNEGGATALGIAVALSALYSYYTNQGSVIAYTMDLIESYSIASLNPVDLMMPEKNNEAASGTLVDQDLASAFRFNFEIDSSSPTQSYKYKSSSLTLPFNVAESIKEKVREYVLPELELLMKVMNRMNIWVDR